MNAAITIILIAAATVAGLLTSRQEEDGPPQGRKAWLRATIYWLTTILVAFEMAAGGLWDLLRIEYVRVILTHLGYPLYLLYIIGVPRIPCALALLAPRFPRLKEWAYAGAFFNYAGAAASHLPARDNASQWIGPLLLAAFTFVSWSLRPTSRKLPRPAQTREIPLLTWCVPALIVAAMLVVAVFTLPKGAPPSPSSHACLSGPYSTASA